MSLLGLAEVPLTIYNNLEARWRTNYDRERNFELNELAANNADKRTRALYEDFYSPEALLKQYNKAGLSPSLMFGGTPGQGGTSGAQGAGTSGLQTPFMPMSLLEAAQASLLSAQTDKTKAETQTINGENERGKAEIQKLLTDNGMAEAAKNLQEAQAAGIKLDNMLKEGTLNYNIEIARHQTYLMRWNSEQAMWDAFNSKQDYEFNLETFKDRCNQIKEQVANTAADTLLKGAQKEYTDEQKKQVTEMVKIAWQQLQLEGEKIATMKTGIQNQKDYWDGCLDKIDKQLKQQLEMFDKSLTQQYIQMGVGAVTNLIGSAMGGGIIQGILGGITNGKTWTSTGSWFQ